VHGLAETESEMFGVGPGLAVDRKNVLPGFFVTSNDEDAVVDLRAWGIHNEGIKGLILGARARALE